MLYSIFLLIFILDKHYIFNFEGLFIFFIWQNYIVPNNKLDFPSAFLRIKIFYEFVHSQVFIWKWICIFWFSIYELSNNWSPSELWFEFHYLLNFSKCLKWLFAILLNSIYDLIILLVVRFPWDFLIVFCMQMYKFQAFYSWKSYFSIKKNKKFILEHLNNFFNCKF